MKTETENNPNLKEIDFKQLEEIVSNEIGTPVKFKVEIKGDRIEFESQNLSSKSGIMSKLYNHLIVGNFGGMVSYDKKKYWVPVNFSWSYKEGGSNGTKIIDAWWNFEDKKWTTHLAETLVEGSGSMSNQTKNYEL